jgi:two-component system, response regulator PdtaR
MNVMIVEDEIILDLNLEDDVHHAGHRSVGFAASYDDALALAPKAEVAFVDVRLRDGVEGPNIARRLIDDYGMNVVFLTGNPEAVEGFEGSLGVLAKPVRDDDVAAVLRYISAKSSGEDAPAPKRLTRAA